MFDKLKTRKGKLENNIRLELESNSPKLKNIIQAVNAYQKDGEDTIEKLKKAKKIDMAKINGALKQTIHAHGPITKELIGSAGKRIYGALIVNPNQEVKKPLRVSLRDVLIGMTIGTILTIVTLQFL